jgi:putative nucleotidyltransferase with HDIG domain
LIKPIKISVSELIIGDKVVKIDASWISNPFFKQQFTIKSNKEINKLKDHKIEYVFIEPRPKKIQEENVNIINRNNISQYYIELNKVDNAFDLYKKSVKILKNTMIEVRAGKLLNKEALNSITKKMIEITKYNKNLLTSISKLKSFDEYTFEHSMNVSVFASSLAKHMGLNDTEIQMLTLGGLLHDTGKMLVPQEILNKPGKLTDEEFKIMKNHVIYGFDYLKKNGFDDNELKIVIEHHERFDGSGYPYGLKDKDISLYGKIGAVVDIYDAITSNRVYHKGMESANAIKMMFNWTDSHINKKVFEFFVAHIGIFPVGTLVLLNTNELAIVGKVTNKPTSPIIIVFTNPKGNQVTPFLVDLSKKSVAQRKILGPVNPSKIDIPSVVNKMLEEMNSSLT